MTRGFAPIGMMEQWNCGIMGSGLRLVMPAYGSERIMQCWINGPATGGNDDKIKMANILLQTNIPAFHHSIIPFSERIRKPQNTSIFSVGCRNSDTFNSTHRLLNGLGVDVGDERIGCYGK